MHESELTPQHIEKPSSGEPSQSTLSLLLRFWTLRKFALPARVSALALVVLTAVWLTLWLGIDWWDALPNPQFAIAVAPLLAWYALAILGLTTLLHWQSRAASIFSPLLLLVLGVVPVPLLLVAVAPNYLSTVWLWLIAAAAVLYTFLYLVRGLKNLTGESRRLAAVGGIVFIAGFIWLTDALDVIPDLWAPGEIEAAAPEEHGADAESLLFDQSARIDRAIAAINIDVSPTAKAFFLGFAGVGEQKVFAQEITLASRVLAERYAIHGRQLSLVNDERDLQSQPLASVTALRYALRGLGARMNPDRDVLFLAISSHGAQDAAIAVANSQLPLNDLTAEDLAQALRESGIKWRVIIISACYAGGFIDSLKGPRSIIITAAAADRTSFGCSNDSDLTYFGEAFYRDALPGSRSLRDAFEQAKSAIAVRERHEHFEASKPQASFGPELEAKLLSMAARAP
jgi:hypothetical protein